MAFNDSSYGVFQGKLFIAPRVMNGPLLGGYKDAGDADMFEIDVKQKFEDIQESRSGMGLTAAHAVNETSISAKIRLLDIKTENWERAVWGTKSGAVAGGTVSGESITLYADSMAPLAHPGVSNVALGGLTLGTDYVVDAANGAIIVLPTSTAVTEDNPVTTTVSYSYGAYTGTVEAFTTGQPVFSLMLQGINTANSNQPVITHCFQWAPDMTKTLKMIDKKHVEFDLDGMLLLDATRPAPTPEARFSQFFNVTKA